MEKNIDVMRRVFASALEELNKIQAEEDKHGELAAEVKEEFAVEENAKKLETAKEEAKDIEIDYAARLAQAMKILKGEK